MRFLPEFVFGLAVITAASLTSYSLYGQDADPLTEDEKQAAEIVTEEVVAETLKYLSSDELEGRGTPSKGFDQACDYVAERFKKAGLKGLAENESYFQITQIKTQAVPGNGTIESVAGDEVISYGMLAGGADQLDWQGTLSRIDPQADHGDQRFEGAVVFEDLESRSLFRELGTIGRIANQVKERGAEAIVILCGADSQLIGYAKSAREPKLENRSLNISLPVILINEETDLSGEFKLDLPAQDIGQTEVRNTIGYIEGSDADLKDEAVIFCAHLDHLGIGGGTADDRINNGADDNASGCTGVMSLADAYAALETPPKRTVIFMTFWGEERGLLGSRYYCDNPLWALDKTVAVINLEMIGRPESGARNKSWVTGWDQSDLGELMAAASERSDVEIFQHPRFSDMLYRASDNWPFVERGVIAHSFSAGSLHQDYHKVTDEFELMQTDHMTQVIKGLFAGSLPIAHGEVTPSK